MSLISNIFPIVLRDVRDGLFRGVSFGFTSFNQSLSQYLRSRLMFDQTVEQKIFLLMEPSEEQAAKRQELAAKKLRLAGSYILLSLTGLDSYYIFASAL